MKRRLPAAQVPLAKEVLRCLFSAGEQTGEAEMQESVLFGLLAKQHKARKTKQKNNLRTNLTVVLSILANHSVITNERHVEKHGANGMLRRTRHKNVRLTIAAKKYLAAHVPADYDSANIYATSFIEELLIELGALYHAPAKEPVLAAAEPAPAVADHETRGYTAEEAPITPTKRKPATKPVKSTAQPAAQSICRAVRPSTAQPPPDKTGAAPVSYTTVTYSEPRAAIATLQAALAANRVLYAFEAQLLLFDTLADAMRHMHCVPDQKCRPLTIQPLILALQEVCRASADDSPQPQEEQAQLVPVVPSSPAADPVAAVVAPLLAAVPPFLMQLVSGLEELRARLTKLDSADAASEAEMFMSTVIDIEHIVHDVKILASQAKLSGQKIADGDILSYAARLEDEIGKMARGKKSGITLLFGREHRLPNKMRRLQCYDRTVKPV